MLDPAPQAAPLRTSERTVPAEWIDYNGHMNVTYYTLAFDQALDEVYEAYGLGQTLVLSRGMGPMALQSQVFFLGELLEGARFACEVRLLDADAKRVHWFAEMHDLGRGRLAATYETLSINVDLRTRRSAPYPEEVQAGIRRLLAAHAALPRPPQAGRPIGIRRASG